MSQQQNQQSEQQPSATGQPVAPQLPHNSGNMPVIPNFGGNGGETRDGNSPSQPAHQPSKVLYVRNVPESVTEQDIIAYCLTFGRVVNILLLRDKRHGFIEFEDESSAIKCYTYYNANPLLITGHRLEFAFSGRSEITARRDPDSNPPNRILLFTITNLVYPVTVDVISQVMNKFGGLEKVIVFNRGNAVQALVQLADVDTANVAKEQLDGQNIYAGCNTIKVQYSSLPQLEVKHNNERSWDFTNPSLLPGGMEAGSGLTPLHQQQMLGGAAGGQSPANLMANFNYVQAMNALSQANLQNPSAAMAAAAAALQASMGAAPVVIVHGLNEQETRPDDLAALFAVYGNVVRVKIMFKARHTALVQMQTVGECHTAIAHLKGIRLHGNKLTMEMSKGGRELPPIPPPGAEQTEADRLSRDYTSQSYLYARHRADQTSRPFPPSSSLYFSNMPHGTTEEDLRELLDASGCQYTGIRFLNEQHHMAIVQCISLDNAIETLCRAHAKPVGHPPRPVRVGFGNTVPKRPVTPPFTSAPIAVMPTFANGAPIDALAYQGRSPPVQAATPAGDMSVAGSSQESFEMMSGIRTMPNPYQAMMMGNTRAPPPGVQRQISAGPPGGQLYSSPNPMRSGNNAQQPF
ncbi:polypyrimidine tract binding protein, putative [Perkinsus marinus ATCC 50983]|uniref:Polypyrimidine tract binding protein, putative n=1 Tax=Perkinsus marinus (strain ATCC 50983 / TXsc) TaxID=423536 RepID=C5L0S5_PERM5|nr:polypyrimidine tract binding protein, putative [Perkinsus marinus ATCC 50983]EER09567.1 polypyrimidine tract binding protein, putative [Perkinsus marinus ATCC 50983]|eukprot:XP_002777772.1 polypyrimidine tract binding protein, putative [Perkinsus marinus ATCC 50983]